MRKTYVLLTLLLAIHMTISVRIEVEYDEIRDIIVHNGKLYFQIPSRYEKENLLPRNLDSVEEELIKEQKKEGAAHIAECEEHLATGASFWFYIFTVLCNIYNI
jgi:hypothetical protein